MGARTRNKLRCYQTELQARRLYHIVKNTGKMPAIRGKESHYFRPGFRNSSCELDYERIQKETKQLQDKY
ncbi:MAG TPA: hypothetical protein DET40_12000 [Lentisphaeria bacterium]|nr:MAG: hypothetical protein A2X45_16745 [Lentisphaerae bacterium GWF2_50_93]HCE44262.1 hypothetical protein [Lentisphaeria bacterium]